MSSRKRIPRRELFGDEIAGGKLVGCFNPVSGKTCESLRVKVSVKQLENRKVSAPIPFDSRIKIDKTHLLLKCCVCGQTRDEVCSYEDFPDPVEWKCLDCFNAPARRVTSISRCPHGVYAPDGDTSGCECCNPVPTRYCERFPEHEKRKSYWIRLDEDKCAPACDFTARYQRKYDCPSLEKALKTAETASDPPGSKVFLSGTLAQENSDILSEEREDAYYSGLGNTSEMDDTEPTDPELAEEIRNDLRDGSDEEEPEERPEAEEEDSDEASEENEPEDDEEVPTEAEIQKAEVGTAQAVSVQYTLGGRPIPPWQREQERAIEQISRPLDARRWMPRHLGEAGRYWPCKHDRASYRPYRVPRRAWILREGVALLSDERNYITFANTQRTTLPFVWEPDQDEIVPEWRPGRYVPDPDAAPEVQRVHWKLGFDADWANDVKGVPKYRHGYDAQTYKNAKEKFDPMFEALGFRWMNEWYPLANNHATVGANAHMMDANCGPVVCIDRVEELHLPESSFTIPVGCGTMSPTQRSLELVMKIQYWQLALCAKRGLRFKRRSQQFEYGRKPVLIVTPTVLPRDFLEQSKAKCVDVDCQQEAIEHVICICGNHRDVHQNILYKCDCADFVPRCLCNEFIAEDNPAHPLLEKRAAKAWKRYEIEQLNWGGRERNDPRCLADKGRWYRGKYIKGRQRERITPLDDYKLEIEWLATKTAHPGPITSELWFLCDDVNNIPTPKHEESRKEEAFIAENNFAQTARRPFWWNARGYGDWWYKVARHLGVQWVVTRKACADSGWADEWRYKVSKVLKDEEEGIVAQNLTDDHAAYIGPSEGRHPVVLEPLSRPGCVRTSRWDAMSYEAMPLRARADWEMDGKAPVVPYCRRTSEEKLGAQLSSFRFGSTAFWEWHWKNIAEICQNLS